MSPIARSRVGVAGGFILACLTAGCGTNGPTRRLEVRLGDDEVLTHIRAEHGGDGKLLAAAPVADGGLVAIVSIDRLARWRGTAPEADVAAYDARAEERIEACERANEERMATDAEPDRCHSLDHLETPPGMADPACSDEIRLVSARRGPAATLQLVEDVIVQGCAETFSAELEVKDLDGDGRAEARWNVDAHVGWLVAGDVHTHHVGISDASTLQRETPVFTSQEHPFDPVAWTTLTWVPGTVARTPDLVAVTERSPSLRCTGWSEDELGPDAAATCPIAGFTRALALFRYEPASDRWSEVGMSDAEAAAYRYPCPTPDAPNVARVCGRDGLLEARDGAVTCTYRHERATLCVTEECSNANGRPPLRSTTAETWAPVWVHCDGPGAATPDPD